MSITFAEGETKPLNITMTPVPLAPASLHGYVTDAETGGAVAGARVELIGLAYDMTNSAGYFEITDIPPGTYSGKVTHPDYYDYTF